MARPNRVFMTGNTINEVRTEAKKIYGSAYTIKDIKHDKNKKVPRGAIIRGKTKYYRVYLVKKK